MLRKGLEKKGIVRLLGGVSSPLSIVLEGYYPPLSRSSISQIFIKPHKGILRVEIVDYAQLSFAALFAVALIISDFLIDGFCWQNGLFQLLPITLLIGIAMVRRAITYRQIVSLINAVLKPYA